MKQEKSPLNGSAKDQPNTTGQISRNTLSLLSARIFEYIGFFFFSLYYIPKLGPSQYGILKYATSLTGLFFILADFGLAMMITRDIARQKKEQRARLIGLGLFLKIILGLFALSCIIVIGLLFQKDPSVRFVVYLFGIAIVFNSLVLYFCGVFQGYEKMQIVAYVRILFTVVVCLLGFFLLESGFGIVGLAFAHITGNAAGVIAAVLFSRKLCGKYTLQMDWLRARSLLKRAFPFGLFALFSTIYLQVDNIMIFHIKGEEALGIYGAATRIIIAVCFFTEAFMGTLYPMLSRFFMQDRKKMIVSFQRAFWFLFITGLPATLGLWRLGKPLVTFLFGVNYHLSGPVLSLLSLLIFFRFIGNVPATLMTAINRQTTRMWLVIGASVLNIGLNLVLIPRYSYMGAAYATITVNVVLMFVYYILAYRAGYSVFSMIPRIIKPGIASVIMLLVLIGIKDIHVLLQFLAGVAVYVFALLLLRSFNLEEKEMLKNAVTGITSHLKKRK